MKKKQTELIQYLSEQNKPINSVELAHALNISSRSIKNYVHEINELYGKSIILSSRLGYELNPTSNYSLLLSKENYSIPQTLEERSFYIIKQLVLNHSKKIEIFDLCDFLCVSYSTVKSIISKMNKTFSSYEVEFICESDCVYIKGSEINKRKLLSYVINEESKNSFMNTNILKKNFGSINVSLLQKIILTTFKKHNFYLNDFSEINLLVHLLIIIDRELNGNHLESGHDQFEFDTIQERDFMNDLQSQLEKEFNIQINAFERFEIYMLFKANANLSLGTSNTNLNEVVGNDLIELTQKYVKEINSLYMIDLSSETFTTPFALHLKNLLFRAEEGRFTINPMTETIKANSPIVFDIAIYMSLDLMDRYHININEDETAFLAMHVGAEIERQANNKTKIPVVLLCPNYHDLVQRTMNTLMMNFGNQINLLGCIQNEYEITKINNPIAILLTALPVTLSLPETTIVHFSPFNLSTQFNTIQDAILKSQKEYRDHKLKINFNNFFEEDLFVSNPNLTSKQQIITYLCDKLYIKKYVDSDFEENVHKRENAATTAFGNVAIPHSAEMNAIKTSVAVAVSKKGFQWGSNTVHVVFLLAINKADRSTFRNLYESLISLFSDNRIVQEMRNCNSFKEFESYIYTWVGEKEND